MKNRIFLFTALSLCSLNLSAQFGIDKIKSKVEKSTKTDESGKSASASGKAAMVSDEQKAIEKELEVYNSYVQGSRVYEVMMNLKKENKTADHFKELATKYNSFNSKSEASLRHIARAEEFYAKMATKEILVAEEEVNRIFTRANKTEYNGNELTLNGTKQEKWKVYPKEVIEDLTKAISELNDQKIYLYTDKTKINELIKKCEDENKRLDAYVKTDYIKFKAEYDKAYLGTILLGKEALNDPAVNTLVKTKFDAKYGKVIKAVILDNRWLIEKTSAGIPKYKFVTFNASVKKADGKCEKHWGRVVMQYEGGGNYGEKYLSYQNSMEMACENVNK